VDELRQKRAAKKLRPTGRRIRRDSWLAPPTVKAYKLSTESELHMDGLRERVRGFLHVTLREYLRLLRWTAKQSVDGLAAKVPDSPANTLTQLGIDPSMWRDLAWNWLSHGLEGP